MLRGEIAVQTDDDDGEDDASLPGAFMNYNRVARRGVGASFLPFLT